MEQKTKKSGGRRPGSGRKKGSPNKLTATVKEAFEAAFRELQSDSKANLVTWALSNQTEFYKLAAKLMPADMNVQGGIQVEIFTGLPSND